MISFISCILLPPALRHSHLAAPPLYWVTIEPCIKWTIEKKKKDPPPKPNEVGTGQLFILVKRHRYWLNLYSSLQVSTWKVPPFLGYFTSPARNTLDIFKLWWQCGSHKIGSCKSVYGFNSTVNQTENTQLQNPNLITIKHMKIHLNRFNPKQKSVSEQQFTAYAKHPVSFIKTDYDRFYSIFNCIYFQIFFHMQDKTIMLN